MTTADEILQITLTDTPLDHPDKMADAAELFRVIGLATSSWARLETHIDMVLILLNQPKHSLELYQKDHPVSFSSKVKLLKRWFNKHPALQPQAGALRTITPQFLELSKQRNIFLHSILSDYDPATKQAIWRGIKPEGEATFRIGRHVGSVDQLINFAAAAHEAHVQFSKVCRNLDNSGVFEQLRKSSQHILRLTRLYRRLRAYLRF